MLHVYHQHSYQLIPVNLSTLEFQVIEPRSGPCHFGQFSTFGFILYAPGYAKAGASQCATCPAGEVPVPGCLDEMKPNSEGWTTRSSTFWLLPDKKTQQHVYGNLVQGPRGQHVLTLAKVKGGQGDQSFLV